MPVMSMTTESESTPAIENETSNPGDSGGMGLDAKNRLIAKALHETTYVYALYGALDGMSLSYSMVKYLFDMRYTAQRVNTSDLMHEWIQTPAGFAAVVAESVILFSVSILANVLSENKDALKQSALKKNIVSSWPYMRDVLKGLKNGYKGVRSSAQVVNMFTDSDLKHLIFPAGLVLGVLAAGNRVWYRRMRNTRKSMMSDNDELFDKILKARCLDTELRNDVLGKFKTQIEFLESIKYTSYLSQLYGGIVDGLYMYMGVMGLATLSPAVSAAMALSCVLYVAMCIVTRIYEEYDYQRLLRASQGKIELAIYEKESGLAFDKLQETFRASGEEGLKGQKDAYDGFMAKIVEFEKKRIKQRELLTLSYSSAALSGLKDGMAAYGVVASFTFATAAVYAIYSTAFPTAFLIASTISGLGLLVGFMAIALYTNHLHIRAQREADAPSKKKEQEMTSHEKFTKFLEDIKKTKEKNSDILKFESTDVKKRIFHGMELDPSPQFFFQEWCEVFRSFFSGVAKGQKSVDYTLNRFQEADANGHYRDTPAMLSLSVASSIVYTIVFALRAHARGFGRASPGVLSYPKPPATCYESKPHANKSDGAEDSTTPSRMPQPSNGVDAGGGQAISSVRANIVIAEKKEEDSLSREPSDVSVLFGDDLNEGKFPLTPPNNGHGFFQDAHRRSASAPVGTHNPGLIPQDRALGLA